MTRSHRLQRLAKTGLGLLAGILLVTLAACSGPAQISAPSPSPQTRDRCKAMVSALPKKNDGHSRRDTKPESSLTTAWGNPAITLACGVSKPAGMKPDSKCWQVNGVGWYADKRSDDYRFTTIGRKAHVQVTVPNKQSPQADALVDLASAIKKHNPVTKKCV